MTLNTYVHTGAGRENTVADRIKKAAKRCKEIVSAAVTPWPGYVRVEVKAGDNAEVKSTKLDLPQNTRMIIEMVPGVVKVLGPEDKTHA